MLGMHATRIRLSATAVNPIPAPPSEAARRRAVILVVGCTFLAAVAQILMKTGADYTKAHPGLAGMMTNPVLIAGYGLYAGVTVLIVVAFKDGELSVLYPILSLSYLWVTALSFFVFHDTFNVYKLIGVTVIVSGVAVLGQGSKK
jgi:multidrug transporter EmrE-like cation transporter